MKRLLCFLSLLFAVAGLGCGLFWTMCWEHWNALQQRQWLEDFFGRRGYVVMWEQNASITMEQFQLHRPDAQTEELYRKGFEKLRESNVIKFYERESDILFVFGKRVYSLQQQKGIAPSNNITTTMSFPAAGQMWVNVQGGGEFTLFYYNEIERLFPFEEVRTLGTRPWHVLYVFCFTEVVICCWMFTGYAAGRQKQPVQFRKMPTVMTYPVTTPIRQGETPPYRPPTKSPPPMKEDVGALRLRVMNMLDDLIAMHDGDMRDYLQSMHREVQSEERIARLMYVLTHRIPSVLEQDIDVDHIEEERIDTFSAPTEIEEQDPRPVLPLDHLIPPEISLPCVKAILRILLGVGGRAPFFGFHRCRYENLQRVVMHEGFVIEEWRATFDWLHKKGVLLYENPHRTGFSCSINPKKQDAPSPGDEIIGILVATRRQLQKRD